MAAAPGGVQGPAARPMSRRSAGCVGEIAILRSTMGLKPAGRIAAVGRVADRASARLKAAAAVDFLERSYSTRAAVRVLSQEIPELADSPVDRLRISARS